MSKLKDQKLFAPSSNQWVKFKNYVCERRPVLKTVDLSKIEIVGMNKLKIEGKTIVCLTNVVNQIAKFVKGDQASGVVNQITGPEQAAKLLNGLKNLISQGRSRPMYLTFVASPTTRQIVDVYKSQANPVTLPLMIELFEQYVNDYDLGIEQFSFNGTQLNLSAVDPTKHSFSFSEQQQDESYNTGLLFRQNGSKVEVHSRVKRLICLNGMLGTIPFTKFQSSSSKTLQHLSNQIEHAASTGFQPGYEQKVTKAAGSLASLREVRFGYKKLLNAVGQDLDNQKSTPTGAKPLKDFVDFEAIEHQYRQLQINVRTIHDNRAATGKVPVKLWDVINNLTDFASHDYGWDLTSQQQYDLQEQASALLYRDRFDYEQTIPSLV